MFKSAQSLLDLLSESETCTVLRNDMPFLSELVFSCLG